MITESTKSTKLRKIKEQSLNCPCGFERLQLLGLKEQRKTTWEGLNFLRFIDCGTEQ